MYGSEALSHTTTMRNGDLELSTPKINGPPRCPDSVRKKQNYLPGNTISPSRYILSGRLKAAHWDLSNSLSD